MFSVHIPPIFSWRKSTDKKQTILRRYNHNFCIRTAEKKVTIEHKIVTKICTVNISNLKAPKNPAYKIGKMLFPFLYRTLSHTNTP